MQFHKIAAGFAGILDQHRGKSVHVWPLAMLAANGDRSLSADLIDQANTRLKLVSGIIKEEALYDIQ